MSRVPSVSALSSPAAALVRQNQLLREDLDRLGQEVTAIGRDSVVQSERYIAVEREHSHVINLYVALARLEAATSCRQVLSFVDEILVNQVGVASFGVVLAAGGVPRWRCVLGSWDLTSIEERRFAACLGRGLPVYADPPRQGEEPSDPIACVPLHAGAQLLGALGVWTLLPQKDRLDRVDRDLLELLGEHTAPAVLRAYVTEHAGEAVTLMRAIVTELGGG